MTTVTAPARPPAHPSALRAGVGLTGTMSLLRLAGRRDRVLVPVSAFGLAAFVALSAQATFELFPDLGAAQASMAPTLSNPALVAMYGPISSLGIDSIATFKSVLLGAVFLALLAYVVVRRHTRTEEEAGRLELLGAGVVGRRAALAAAVILGTGAVLLTVVLTVAWAIAVGLDPAGSVALGVTWLVIGLSWVGVTAVAAQLTSSTRGTAGWSLGALAVAFLVRAVGDTASADSPARFLSWITPLGWGVKVRPSARTGTGWCCSASRSTPPSSSSPSRCSTGATSGPGAAQPGRTRAQHDRLAGGPDPAARPRHARRLGHRLRGPRRRPRVDRAKRRDLRRLAPDRRHAQGPGW